MTVATGADVVNDGDGVLSLREALLIANDSTGATVLDGISSTDFADVIVFSNGVFDFGVADAIQLAGTQLPAVTERLTIDGAIDAGSARITIDANGRSRVFEIGSAGTLRLENLILAEGSSGAENGGAIHNGGVLEMVDADITASTSSASGGAISNDGTLRIAGGSIAGNSAAGAGGGIFNDGGTATVAGTLIENNTAGVQGGGVFNAGTMTITDAAIDGNRAESESSFVPSPLTVGNILINNDPYGPASLIEYTVDGTLVRTLPLSIGQDIALDAQGRVQVYAAPELITYDPATQAETTLTVPGWSSVGNLTYGGLAAFGPFIFGTDQETAYDGAPRGVIRIDTRDGSWIRFGDIDCFDLNVGLDGLLYVLSQGNAPSAGGTRITVFDPLTMVNLGTIELPVVVRAIAIDSAGEIFTARSSGTQHFIQHFDSAGNLLNTLSTEVGGLADIDIRRDEQYLLIVSHGGEFVVTTPALDNEAVFNSGVSDNVAFGTFIQPPVGVSAQSQGAGGGVFNGPGASLTIAGGQVTGNFALLSGGGLQNNGGTLTLDGVLIDANMTDGDGAGLHNSGAASVAAAAVVITNNAAADSGGGVWTSASGTFSFAGGTIAANRAQSGAGVFSGVDTASLNVTASTISGNNAVATGGGLQIEGGSTFLANSTISGNQAQTNGGGVRANGGTLTLLSTTIAANRAEFNGGGVDEQGAFLTAQSTIIATNTAAVSAADFRGTLQSNGFNLIGDAAGVVIGGLAATDLTDVDPRLDILEDNGGPTKTHALLAGSPAINAGSNAAGAVFDQRGAPFTRSFAEATDIGAFELHVAPDLFAVAAGPGGGPAVAVFDTLTGQMTRSFFAFDRSFRGGITVATGDLNNDTFPEIIVGIASAGPPEVRVFDGLSGALISSFFAFPARFQGGLTIATGDVSGDGNLDVIVGARAGGGPAVRVFNGLTGAPIGTPFFAFDKRFRGGVNVATGDVDGNGTDEIIVGAGPGGGPAVRVFDFSTLDAVQVGRFFAFPVGFKGGVFVSAGDLDEDGDSEIVAGAGPGGGPAVRIFAPSGTQIGDRLFAFPVGFRGGVRVATADADGDADTDILVGAGPGGGPAVRMFDPDTGAEIGKAFFALPKGFRGGLFLAGRALGLPGEGGLLTVDPSIPPPADSGPAIDEADLPAIIAAAQARFSAAGISPELLAALSGVKFFVTDLRGDLLGLARNGIVYLDDDAAGYGWFVDFSPLVDEEFSSSGTELRAVTGSSAGARIDLLTAVLHELGHVLGLEHGDGLMDETLAAGVRRLPTTDDSTDSSQAICWIRDSAIFERFRDCLPQPCVVAGQRLWNDRSQRRLCSDPRRSCRLRPRGPPAATDSTATEALHLPYAGLVYTSSSPSPASATE